MLFLYHEIRIAERDDPSNASMIYVDPGWSTAQEIAELFIALSELHRAQHGGRGLTFEITHRVFGPTL